MADLPEGMPDLTDEQLQELMEQLKKVTEEAEAGGSAPGGVPPPIGRSSYGVMGYDNMYLFFTAVIIPAAVIDETREQIKDTVEGLKSIKEMMKKLEDSLPDYEEEKIKSYAFEDHESPGARWPLLKSSLSINILATIVLALLLSFFLYKLVSSLREKERLKEEKRLMKQQRKEKEAARKSGNKKSR